MHGLGTAIYMSTVVGPFSGFYTATIDGETVVVDAYRNISEPVCEVSWSRWGLENTTHVVSVVFRGSSVLAGPDTTGNSSLEITRFTYVLDFLGLSVLIDDVGVSLISSLFLNCD